MVSGGPTANTQAVYLDCHHFKFVQNLEVDQNTFVVQRFTNEDL